MGSFHANQTLIANYDAYYEADSPWRRLGAIGKADNLVALCNAYAHKTILDIGSGEGSLLKRLSDLGFGEALYSLEISQSGVEAVRNKHIGALAECRLYGGYEIPYPDDRFDLAVLSHVVEHLEYPRKLLYEVARVARHLFVEVPLEDNLRLGMDFAADAVGHINWYTPKTIRRLVQTCGFEVLAQRTTNPSFAVYQYQSQSSWKAGIRYVAKEFALRFVPGMATGMWTYHEALVARRAGARRG